MLNAYVKVWGHRMIFSSLHWHLPPSLNASGVAGSEKLLKESLAAAQREAVLTEAELKRVNVDTTVQEKAIAFPTDARLYHKARQALVRVAKSCNFK